MPFSREKPKVFIGPHDSDEVPPNVYSVGDGSVVGVAEGPYYKITTRHEVDGGVLYVEYYPLNTCLVTKGDSLKKNGIIGTCIAPHLEVAVFTSKYPDIKRASVNRKYINPLSCLYLHKHQRNYLNIPKCTPKICPTDKQ